MADANAAGLGTQEAVTLRAIRAVVVDYVAFERDELVDEEDLAFGSRMEVAGDVAVAEGLALVVALAVDGGGRRVVDLVEGGELGAAGDVTDVRVVEALQRGRALDDGAAASEWLLFACWSCGCREDRACEDGCRWVAANRCSACVEQENAGA